MYEFPYGVTATSHTNTMETLNNDATRWSVCECEPHPNCSIMLCSFVVNWAVLCMCVCPRLYMNVTLYFITSFAHTIPAENVNCYHYDPQKTFFVQFFFFQYIMNFWPVRQCTVCTGGSVQWPLRLSAAHYSILFYIYALPGHCALFAVENRTTFQWKFSRNKNQSNALIQFIYILYLSRKSECSPFKRYKSRSETAGKCGPSTIGRVKSESKLNSIRII